MYSIVVLGLVPGTNVQINFGTWIDVILLGIALFSMRNLYFRWRHVPLVLDTRQIPVHASTLHRRG